MVTLERPELSPQLDNIAESAVPTPFQANHPASSQTAAVAAREELTRTASRSPSSTGRRLSGLMDKMKRTLSRDRGASEDRGRESEDFSDTITEESSEERGRTGGHPLVPSLTNTSRSFSRGRTPLLSYGRGGAGNFVPPASITGGNEDEKAVAAAREKSRSASRGREEVVATGRGGRGNLRSASRGPNGEVPGVEDSGKLEREDRAVVERIQKEEDTRRNYSTGRGGAGNMRRKD